jgi:hypothetical protein
MKGLLEPIDNRDQRRDVGRIARPQLGTDRMAVPIQDEADDHLFQIGSMIPRMPMPAQGVAAGPVEIEQRRIEEHEIQAGEQIAAAGKQRLLDPVFGQARGKRGRRRLLGLRQRLPQPRHRAIQMMEFEIRRAGNRVIVPPSRRRPVAAGRHQPM